MKCIMLVGGYATRMRPLTLKQAKALLPFKDKTVLDSILENIINSNNMIDEFLLITNDTFYNDFLAWKEKANYKEKITIVSDGSTCEERKVGALMAFINVLKTEKIDDDIFLLAGDNILDFSLEYIFEIFNNGNDSCIMYYDEPNEERLRKTGVIEIDKNDYIVAMEEKPKEPKSNHAVPPFYWIKKHDLQLDIFNNTFNKDSLGNIILCLCEKSKVKAIKMKGKRYDIGSIDIYNKLNGE